MGHQRGPGRFLWCDQCKHARATKMWRKKAVCVQCWTQLRREARRNAGLTPPAPGSDAALDLGCVCSVLDNGHGRGAYISREGVPQYWMDVACPLHGADGDGDE